MSYEEKSIENRKVAIICYNNNYFDACVNRYYYSFYQKVLQKLVEHGIQVGKNYDKKITTEKHIDAAQVSSHQTTIDEYKKIAFSNGSVKISKKKWAFEGLFKEIKDARQRADYFNKSITKNEATKIAKTYTNLINILNES